MSEDIAIRAEFDVRTLFLSTNIIASVSFMWGTSGVNLGAKLENINNCPTSYLCLHLHSLLRRREIRNKLLWSLERSCRPRLKQALNHTCRMADHDCL